MSLLLLFSCTDYLDVNNDPNNPTSAPLDQLLTDIEINFKDITDFQNLSGEVFSCYVHQFTFREEQDQYGAKQDYSPVKNSWNISYAVMAEADIIINQGTEEEEMIMVGMAQVLKGYTATILVNVWGEAPFSEAGRGHISISTRFNRSRFS